MAVLGLQTLNGANIYNVDADPTQSGVAAPLGSLALFRGALYVKIDADTDTAWQFQGTNLYLNPDNGATAGGLTFTEWPAAHAVAASLEGPATIFITGTTALDIPSGTYDMENILIEGPSASVANINIRDGASFTNLNEIGKNIFFRNFDASTPPLLQTVNGTLRFRVGRGSILRNNVVGGALIRVTAGALELTLDGANMTFGSQPCVDLTTTNVNSQVIMNDISTIDDNQFSGTSTISITINGNGSTFDSDQPNHSGAINVTNNQIPGTPRVTLPVTTAYIPSSGGMTLTNRNNHPVLEAPDASTTEVYWTSTLASTYLGNSLRFTIWAVKNGAGSGNARLTLAMEILSNGDNITTDNFLFNTAITLSPAVDGVIGFTTLIVSSATLGSPSEGDMFRLRLQREGGDAADTLGAPLQIVQVDIEEV